MRVVDDGSSILYTMHMRAQRGAWEEARLALFPGLHAQLLSLATKAGRGGLGTKLV